jgi:hypothetical protein
MSALSGRAVLRPKLAWRVGLVVVALGFASLGRALGDVVIALMLGVFAFYAWTASLHVFPDRIEKRTWTRAVRSLQRPVFELEYIRVNAIARRALEIGPMGSSIVLEIGFWNSRGLRALVRELLEEARDLGDETSRACLLRYAQLEEPNP